MPNSKETVISKVYITLCNMKHISTKYYALNKIMEYTKQAARINSIVDYTSAITKCLHKKAINKCWI